MPKSTHRMTDPSNDNKPLFPDSLAEKLRILQNPTALSAAELAQHMEEAKRALADAAFDLAELDLEVTLEKGE